MMARNSVGYKFVIVVVLLATVMHILLFGAQNAFANRIISRNSHFRGDDEEMTAKGNPSGREGHG
ncbi:unnamed protein product [Linum tenue]|uniref:Transmembrane protein n=1 Tax=Linum tenue TaxID=586396 RepID=A0AAV0RK16_9ROSI|nr:unnamed protein product [Linum tenue]